MTIAIISILIITFVVWSVKKWLKFEVCPICAGVSLTWIWMLVAMILGKLSTTTYQLPTALLMGGTVVGFMSKLEEFIKPKFILVWKTLFVVLGFMAVYSLIYSNFISFILITVLVVTITLIFKTQEANKDEEKSKQIKELEEKMKNCC